MSLEGGFGTLIRMKKPVIIISSIVFLLATFLIVYASRDMFKKCDLEVDKVCFNNELNQYNIEEDAVLTIEVPSSEYGEAIKQLWSTYHPDSNPINTVLVGQSNTNDLMYLSQNDAALKFDELYPMTDDLMNDTPQISPELNLEALKYLPMVGEGFAFITNKTEIERLVGSWTDTNKNNIHDSLESYEAIIKAQANWKTDKRKLVLSLNEPFSMYPLFTSDGWRIFEDYSSYYPGFEKETFLESLKFIELLSSVNWNNTEINDAVNYTWDYPSVLFEDNFVFSQVASWMYFDEMDLKHESEWVISALPKAYENSENPLRTMLTKVYGYSINLNTLYPSAAHELMRLVYSTEGLQTKLDYENVILLSNKDKLDALSFKDEHLKQFSYAFIESQSEPLVAVEDYPNHLAIRLYYEIDLESSIHKLWNKEITKEEAQIELATQADTWIMKNSKLFEGKINHE